MQENRLNTWPFDVESEVFARDDCIVPHDYQILVVSLADAGSVDEVLEVAVLEDAIGIVTVDAY